MQYMLMYFADSMKVDLDMHCRELRNTNHGGFGGPRKQAKGSETAGRLRREQLAA